MEEFVIVVVGLGLLATAMIFPIWLLVLLYTIKSRQDGMNAQLQKLVAAEKLRENASPQGSAPKDSATASFATTVAKVDPPKATVQADIPVPQSPVSKPPTTVSQPPPAPVAAPKISVSSSFQPAPAPQPRKESEFERGAREICGRIWSWFVVGEEHRPKNVSFEYAVASVWLLRASMLIILTGIGFFLKYSIENNLVGPYGRIATGITVGLAMIAAGVKMTGKKYHLIAQGLLGGGIATLYLSIFASYKIYKLVPDVRIAFALMIFITICAAVMAVRFNSMLVAVFGIIGGYCTPVMLSTGTADLPGLFSYVLMLGAGVVVIAKYKDWKLLNAMSFAFTYGLYWAATYKFYTDSDFQITIVFLSLFFLLFASIPIINNVIHGQKSNGLTLVGMFLNALAFFPSATYLITDLFERRWLAVATVGLAVFYTIQIVIFISRKLVDKNLLMLLTGFASFFITLTIPMLLSDEWITTAWSIQALIFLWMSIRTKSNFIRLIAYVLYFLSFAHLTVFDFHKNFRIPAEGAYFEEMLTRIMTFGSLIVSMALGYRLLRGEMGGSGIIAKENDTTEFIPAATSSSVFAVLGAALLFVYLHFEFRDLSSTFYPPCKMPLISLIWASAIVICSFGYARSKNAALMAVSVLLCVGLLFKVLIFDFSFWEISIDGLCFSVGSLAVDTSMRSLNFFMIAGAFAWAFMLVAGRSKSVATFFAVLCLSTLFAYSTLELNTFLGYKVPRFRAGGISILWALFALSFILSGIKKKVKALRYVGLLIFTVVVLKVFISDLSRLSQLYRIIAFIALGLVVLAGSFIYIKFKDSFKIGEKDEKNSP